MGARSCGGEGEVMAADRNRHPCGSAAYPDFVRPIPRLAKAARTLAVPGRRSLATALAILLALAAPVHAQDHVGDHGFGHAEQSVHELLQRAGLSANPRLRR